MFEQDQRRNEFACLLGFENAASAEASITSKDPWVPGGKAALLEANARILLLEDELAKHTTASEEALFVITETKDLLEKAHQYLDDSLADVIRLRQERDLAREKAEMHAMEANTWRTEVQRTLPEMQNLIRKQQEDSKTLFSSRPVALIEQKTLTLGQQEHTARWVLSFLVYAVNL